MNMDHQLLSNNSQIPDYLRQPVKVPINPDEWFAFWRQHSHTYEVIWKSEFLIFDDAPLLPRPGEVLEQVARTKSYWCDCKFREEDQIRYFCYTLSGTGSITDPSGTYLTPPGTAFLAETDNPHTYYCYPADATEPWRFLSFCFYGLQAHVMVRALLQNYGPIYELPLDAPIIERLRSYEGVHYENAQVHLVQMDLYEAAGLVMDLLMSLMASKRAGNLHDATDDIVQQAIKMIMDTNPADLRVNEIARVLGVSREHLSRLFQNRLGKSLRSFILEQKVRRACLLLKETSMPIKTIAEVVGYTAYPNFATTFQKVTKLTPHQYRLHGVLPHALATGSQVGHTVARNLE